MARGQGSGNRRHLEARRLDARLGCGVGMSKQTQGGRWGGGGSRAGVVGLDLGGS